MPILDKIKQPIEKEFAQYEQTIQDTVSSDNSLLQQLTAYVLSVRGKQMRPILGLLVAKLCGGITNATINGAISVELLHIASLIHDDVLDSALERRARPSVNAVFQNKLAILGGDFLFSKSLSRAAATNSISIIEIISKVGANLVDGEIVQLANSKQNGLTEAVYFDIIAKKTAALFAGCTQIAAISAGATEKQEKALHQFGENIGICFQLRDDIFDYYNDNIGKPTGNDLKEGKTTLPLLYAIQNANKEEADEALKLMKKNSLSDDEVAFLQSFSIRYGGIDYAKQKMQDYYQKAISQLDDFEPCDAKDALLLYADYVINRVL